MQEAVFFFQYAVAVHRHGPVALIKIWVMVEREDSEGDKEIQSVENRLYRFGNGKTAVFQNEQEHQKHTVGDKGINKLLPDNKGIRVHCLGAEQKTETAARKRGADKQSQLLHTAFGMAGDDHTAGKHDKNGYVIQ